VNSLSVGERAGVRDEVSAKHLPYYCLSSVVCQGEKNQISGFIAKPSP
jgi:hypothetical protein